MNIYMDVHMLCEQYMYKVCRHSIWNAYHDFDHLVYIGLMMVDFVYVYPWNISIHQPNHRVDLFVIINCNEIERYTHY